MRTNSFFKKEILLF